MRHVGLHQLDDAHQAQDARHFRDLPRAGVERVGHAAGEHRRARRPGAVAERQRDERGHLERHRERRDGVDPEVEPPEVSGPHERAHRRVYQVKHEDGAGDDLAGAVRGPRRGQGREAQVVEEDRDDRDEGDGEGGGEAVDEGRGALLPPWAVVDGGGVEDGGLVVSV